MRPRRKTRLAGPDGAASPAENLWEGFAQTNAEYFILTKKRDYSDPAKLRWFFDSGRSDVQRILACVAPWLGERRMAIEIGCGVGRLTMPMAGEFATVVGVDVAPTMLEKLAQNCRSHSIDNVVCVPANAESLRERRADLVYSRLVLQHVEPLAEIERYIALTAGWLARDGIGYLQFDTRPATAAYRLREVLPDRILPRDRRRGIRRVRRSPETIARLLGAHGLATVKEDRPGSADHVYVVRARNEHPVVP